MRIGKANGQDWLRLGEAATALGVSLNTLRRWTDSGKLVCYRSPGGHRRYRHADIGALLGAQSRDRQPSGATGALPAFTAGDADADFDLLGPPLSVLAQVAAEGIGVTSCVFALLVGEGRLRIVAGYGRAGGPPPADEVGPLEDAPAPAEVLRSGRRLVIADLATTNLLPRGAAEAYREGGEAALLAVPLVIGGRRAGVMQLADARAPRAFTSANVAFAEFVARQAARLMAGDERFPEEDAPQDPHLAVDPPATRAPRTVLHGLAERLRMDLGAVACDVLRYDRDERALTLVAATKAVGETSPPEGIAYPVADAGGVVDALAGDTVTLHDLAARDLAGTSLLRFEQNGARSAMFVPVRLGDNVTGVLEVFSADPRRALDARELALVRAAAALTALTLEDAGGETTRRVGETDDLIADATLHSPAGDAERLVRATLHVLQQAFDLSAGAVYEVDSGTATAIAAAPPSSTTERWRLDEYPPAAAAVAGRSMVVIARDDDPMLAAEVAARFLAARGLAGVVLAPLVYQDDVVGLLEMGSGEPGRTEDLAEAAEVLADLLAQLFGGANVIAGLQRRNRALAKVVEAGNDSAARQGSDEVLRAVVERLAELTHATSVDMYTVENDTLRALVSYDGGRFDLEWEDVVIPLVRYPCSRRAVESGEMVTVASLDDPLLDEEARYSLEKWGYQALLSMPLVSGGRVIGLVELSEYVPRDFGRYLELVRGLCGVAAHALENAALVEQAERRSRILNELVELGDLGSRPSDIEGLERDVAQRLQAAVDAANCDIFRVTGVGLRCVASFDRSGYDERPVGDLLDLQSYPTVVAAMNSHQILIITSPDDPRLSQSERRTYREYGYASEVCVPLVVNDELYGLIDIYDTRERDYTEYLSFLKSAGQTLASAFENALLVERVERCSRSLSEIVSLGLLASQTRDLEGMLGALAQRVRAAVEAADCDIFTLQGESLRCVVSADLDGFDEAVVGVMLDMDKFPATAMAVRSGEAMAVAGLDDPRLTAEERASMAKYGFESEFCIPLVADERVIGLIDVFDTRPRDYGEYVDFLRSVGHMAAAAIQNASLVDKLEHILDG